MSLQTTLSKPRIEVIDALRGFALMGILLLHCLEHFEVYGGAETASEALKWLDKTMWDTTWFIFARKSYAMFALLFGLSFFIQMENQRERGIDFRWRFAWRLMILYALGWINGLFYQGDIFAVYALFGLLLIPLWKVPSKWLLAICLFLIFQVPNLIKIIWMNFDTELATTASDLRIYYRPLFKESVDIYREGSLGDILSFNTWKGHLQKWITMFITSHYMQIPGLFLAGLLIGRKGLHKEEDKALRYGIRGFWIGLFAFAACYMLQGILTRIGIEAPEIKRAVGSLLTYYVNSAMLLMWIGLFVICWFRLKGQKILGALAPYGRMSVTNYMLQSTLGTVIFYGFGLGMGQKCGSTLSLLIGIALLSVQLAYSRWWLRHYYYGPVEWLWRSLTWLSFKTPLKRN